MSTFSNPQEIINSLDGIRRAEPQPFFTGRLLARMQAANEPLVQPFWYRWGWTLTFAFLLILIGINILLISRHTGSEQGMLTEYERTTPRWVENYTTQPSASIYASPNK